MVQTNALRLRIKSLIEDYQKLPDKNFESEKRVEEFLRPLFEEMGWKWLSSEVNPQTKVRSSYKTTRVDYSFKKSEESRASFYLDAKRFSNDLDKAEDVMQVLGYGKNSRTRWVILTNFIKWRVFNSDYFDQPDHAELFGFELEDCLTDEEALNWLILFSREQGGVFLDEYAKKHKKWKESADIEDLLTEQLLHARKTLSMAIRDQNKITPENQGDIDDTIDLYVQTIIDRVIFCRMLEDNGADLDRRLQNILEKWETGDRRVQFYEVFLCPFFRKMHEKYDSSIFSLDGVDGLSIKNEDFIPILKSFYIDEKTKLNYRFDVINTDVLGHAYENYLAYRVTSKRKGLEEELYKRKQGGIYYTPEFLVDYLIRSTLGELLKKCKKPEDVLRIRVLDPACGSGTFLVRAFDEFKKWFEEHELKSRKKVNTVSQTRLDFTSETGVSNFLDSVLENCIYGIDLDSRAANLARLNLFLRAVGTPKKLPRLNILERNSLVWDEKYPNAFLMERDFPLVHEAGGFDVIVGNPPWEKWKPDSQEFFEPYEPGFKKLPAQIAKKRMEEILKTKPNIRKLWNQKNDEYEMYSRFFRENYDFQSSKVNGKMVSGDLDLYKLFTERAYHLIKENGMVGFVIPSGVYTDLGAKGLRQMLFEKCNVKGLFSFENRGHAIFPDVHASYKPILLVFQKGKKTISFPAAFFLHTVEDLNNAIKNPTVLDTDFIKKASPTAWSVLEIKSPADYEIVRKILRFLPIGKKDDGNWNMSVQSGFHMTNDSHLFRPRESNGVPMLEGKNIEQFTHRWRESPTPRYSINQEDVADYLKGDRIYHKSYWMAYRLIASSTNYRTLISTIVPPGYVCGNSIAIIRLGNLRELCFLCGVVNSFVVDYFIRQKVSANINMFYFLETPIPRLSSGKEFEEIVKKVAQLVCVTNEFSELKKISGIQHGLTNENDRNLARAQLDVMVAKLYGIAKEELAYILTKFPIVSQKHKDLILSQY